MPLRLRLPSLALASFLGFALLAANQPGPALGPPNGTYVYVISRNGTDQGKTTVAVFRREAEHAIELDESGTVGAARAHLLAAYADGDLSLQSYVGTYQAPFLRSSAFGRAGRFRPKAGFYDQTTARYHFDAKRALDTIDGVPGERVFSLAGSPGPLHDPWLFDAPFMAGGLFLPAFRRRAGDATLVTVDDAFGQGAVASAARIERDEPRFPKTPKTDVVLDVDGVAHLWFDPNTLVVHEAHFDALNLDARLVSYTRAAEPAPFLPAPAPSAAATVPGTAVSFDVEDSVTLAGELQFPPGAKHAVPVLVFVPPGPDADVDFGGEGPQPMFPDLADTFVRAGYAVLRYDTRGVGKSGGSSATETWDQARADAAAAISFASGDGQGIDPKRVYVLGYGNGADLALAAGAASDVPIAGVIALAPTVTSYRGCEASASPDPLYYDGRLVEPSDGSWRKSAAQHDPSALAARVKAPVFVLEPGLPICKEAPEQRDAYDEKLRAANPFATIVVANDLTERFGGRYDADSPFNTEALFPYRFDASTAGAIVDWLNNPKTAASGSRTSTPAGAGPHAPPPPPPAPGRDQGTNGEYPNPHAAPGTPRPAESVQPGVVLPSGVTPPP